MTIYKSLRSMSLIAAVALMLTTGGNAFATNIPQQLEEAKMKYERLYKQYVESLSNATSSGKHALAGEVEAAKRRYEELKTRFTMSESTKDSIKNTADQVKETVGKIFASGSGSNDSVASSTISKELPGYDAQDINIDGDNYCGQFAMTSVFHGMGIPMDCQKVYKDTNPAGIFTAPPIIVEYLNMNGVDATEKHNASISDIVKKIDSGKPVMVLMSSGSTTPHWVTVFGYTTDAAGNLAGFKVRDSYWGHSEGYTMNIERFTNLWKSPLGEKFPGSICGYSNLMIDIQGPRVAAFSPPLFNFNFNTATEDNIAGGINDVVTGYKRVAPMQLAGGVVKCVLGLPGAAVGLSGRGITMAGNAVMSWGKDKFSQGSLGDKIIGGSAIAVGGLAKAAGWLTNQAGNLLSGAASIFGNATKKLGYVFAR